VAVAAFLSRRCAFLEIAAIVEDTLMVYDPPAPADVAAVLAVDGEARRIAAERVKDRVA
jgi:1-deoxy-D-xylulose-5-phosphate reductoisomerase